MEKLAGSIRPPQKISSYKKNSEWKEKNIDYYLGKVSGYGSYSSDTRKKNLELSYGLYNSEFDMDDFKYVTNPFNVEDGFPAKVQNINIIKPVIDLLIGEGIKRKNDVTVIQTNPEVVNEFMEKKKELLLQFVESLITGEQSQKNNDNKPLTLEEIEKYIRKTYKSVPEEVATNLLKYYHQLLNLDNETIRGLKDLLVSSEIIFYTGALEGSPFVERVNPMYCDYDRSPELQYIEDGEWFVREMKMSPSILYDRYHDKIPENKLNEILNRIGEYSNTSSSIAPNERVEKVWNIYNTTKDMYNEGDDNISVWHVVWRSYKKIGLLTITDEDGAKTVVPVDDTYKPDNNEDIEWIWIDDIWEGYKAFDIYFGIEPLSTQSQSIDKMRSKKLPYVGAVINNDNTPAKSLPILMKAIQYMYIVVWYRIELTIARDKGKILNMDITQIPKGLGIDVNQWAHYLSALGINFINPYDEGWDIPGREGGNPSPYNQITSVDLTSAQALNEYVSLLVKLEEMAGNISGVSRQRLGSVSDDTLVGTYKRSVIQSSHITESYYWVFSQVKKNLYSQLIEIAKNIYQNSPDKVINFILGDIGRVFININEDFLFSDFDVFVSNSQKDLDDLELIKSTLLQPAMQNGATLLEITEVLNSDSISEIKNKLIEIETRKEKMLQQQAEKEQALREEELKLREKEMTIQEQDSIRDAQTNLLIAEIRAKASEGSEADLEKVRGDLENKKRELDLKEKELNQELRLKEKELNIKKNNPTKK